MLVWNLFASFNGSTCSWCSSWRSRYHRSMVTRYSNFHVEILGPAFQSPRCELTQLRYEFSLHEMSIKQLKPFQPLGLSETRPALVFPMTKTFVPLVSTSSSLLICLIRKCAIFIFVIHPSYPFAARDVFPSDLPILFLPPYPSAMPNKNNK